MSTLTLAAGRSTTMRKMRPPPLSLSISTSPSTPKPTTSPTLRTPISPSHAADHNSASLNFYPDGPATILPNLLLGSEQNASDVSILSRYNVKCVLNVAKEVTNPLLEAKAVPMTARPMDSNAAPMSAYPFDAAPLSSIEPPSAIWSALPFSPRPGAIASQKLPLPLRAQDFEGAPSPSPTDSSFPSPASSLSSITSPSTNPTLDNPSTPPPPSVLTSAQHQQPYSLPAYFKLPWSHAESDLLTQFTRAFTYIDAAVSQNLPVLVACQQGVSRSASLVIAYVMATKRMTLEESYEYVKKCSPNVCPNVGFMAQLVEFEMMLKKEREAEMDLDMEL